LFEKLDGSIFKLRLDLSKKLIKLPVPGELSKGPPPNPLLELENLLIRLLRSLELGE
jgi:hypothetical protein